MNVEDAWKALRQGVELFQSGQIQPREAMNALAAVSHYISIVDPENEANNVDIQSTGDV